MAAPRYPDGNAPHVHVPYNLLDKYFSFLKSENLNLELYFGSRSLDGIGREDIVALKKKLDYNPQLTIHAPFMDLSPGAVDPQIRTITMGRFHQILDFAEVLKPAVIVFHSGYDRWKYDNRMDIWLEASLETWVPVNERAAAMGVRLAIENIFEDEPGNLKRLVTQVGSDNFGLCFDSGHFNLFSKLTLLEWLAMIKPYIFELHLHDNARYADNHLAIGDGDFDFKTLFAELNGVNCVHTIEAHSPEDVLKSLRKLKEYAS